MLPHRWAIPIRLRSVREEFNRRSFELLLSWVATGRFGLVVGTYFVAPIKLTVPPISVVAVGQNAGVRRKDGRCSCGEKSLPQSSGGMMALVDSWLDRARGVVRHPPWAWRQRDRPRSEKQVRCRAHNSFSFNRMRRALQLVARWQRNRRGTADGCPLKVPIRLRATVFNLIFFDGSWILIFRVR